METIDIWKLLKFESRKSRNDREYHPVIGDPIIYIYIYMGGCQNYGPFLGTLNIRGRIIMGTPKRTIILTTTHMIPAW